MIAILQCVVLDCPDVSVLAGFYQGLLGGEINRPDSRWSVDDDWATLHVPGGQVLAFQRVADHRPPRRTDQQFHLDLEVADLDQAQRAVLDLGGALVDATHSWRVFRDPAAHPFCLVRH
ncbi:VOC family protein [Pseudonocardiaceae bacterium YIM PH 21723]|nr:VOC family protein [Pseudonocardiaceae bacterium YIM PH 21723]